MLVDLPTADEEREDEYNACLRFDIELLTRRVVAITNCARNSRRQRDIHLVGNGRTGEAQLLNLRLSAKESGAIRSSAASARAIPLSGFEIRRDEGHFIALFQRDRRHKLNPGDGNRAW
ncbi:MAG TPA: hypothetical protein VMG40_21215 [Bryobacteraceae bacterium]|nr:hypothetical protein [Bryobacteraceae bacterium]